MTISLRRARVRATFVRRVSARNPTSPVVFERTSEMTRFFLAALEAIHGVDLDRRIVEQRSQQSRLRGIRRDDRDLGRSDTRCEQLLNLPSDDVRFAGIVATGTIGLRLFHAV